MKKIFLSLFLLLLINLSLNAQINIVNVRSYNSNMGSNDYVVGMVTDAVGNIFTTGHCTDGVTSFLLNEKYNSSGTKIWSKIYRSMNNSSDYAVSIARDSLGGIYIAGYSKGITSSNDFLLVKYNDQGDTIWSRRYNGTGNGDDKPIKVAVDRNNNIVIAGNAVEASQGINTVLIKYDINGNQIWIKKFNGTTNQDDRINDFCFDKNNFIYIASTNNCTASYGNGYYSVVKFNAAGDTLWSRSILSYSYGNANSVLVDETLNVYVTGGQRLAYDTNAVLTIKYNSNGTELWRATYCQNSLHTDYGYRLAFDETGNLYVAGDLTSIITSLNPQIIYDGYFLAKYTSGGQCIWVKEIPRSYTMTGTKCHLKVLSSSVIYVGFLRYLSSVNYVKGHIARFNSNGDTVWTRIVQNQKTLYAFNSMELDNSGNILCGGASNISIEYDASVYKYNSSGILSWEKYTNSAGYGLDKALNIGKDYQNNIYVTGMNDYEYFLIKYNSSFTQQWTATYSDGSARDDLYSFSAFDSTGNTYLTGTTRDSLNKRYIILIKYNSNGSLEWQRKYTVVPAQSWGVQIDRSGNIIIAGTYYDANNRSTLVFLKYNPSGVLLMNTSYNASNNYNIWVNSFEIDSDNNLIIAGDSQGAIVFKFKNNGAIIWEKNIIGTYVNSFNKIKLDKKNSIFACGFYGTSSGYDFITLKLDSSGNQKWLKTFNGAKNSEDMAEDLVVDTLGNTYVTGSACNQTSSFNRSIVTIKYDSTGNVVWLKDLISNPNGNLTPAMISKDRFNNIYVLSGYSGYQPFSVGYLTVKYKQNGDSIWSFSYSSSIASNYGKSLLFINDNKFYISGRAYGINTGYDLTTLEMSQVSEIKISNENTPEFYSLSQNYPNPFNPTTNIKFRVPYGSIANNKFVTLKVFDILGKEIATLVNEKLKAGEYEVTFDGTALPSGVYFYKLTSGDFTETKKMILLK